MMPKYDPDDLLDAGEVAELVGLSHRNSVSLYRRRHADFPTPVLTKGRLMLWSRRDIVRWRTEHS
jgi:predicted DNA-binding transcriptional regulator AlpA